MKRIFILISFFCLVGVANIAFSQAVKINHNGTNGLTVESDGTIKLDGAATVWNDLVVNPSVARNNGGTVPTWGLFVATNIYTWLFDKAATEELSFSVQIPHDYKEGSDIYPHIHWAPMNAAGTTRAKWVIEYQWINLGTSFAATTTASLTGYLLSSESSIPTVSLTERQSTITPLGAITGSGKTVSSILMCRIYRFGSDTNDNLDADAALLSLDFHYQIDAIGSRDEYDK